ncbi:hypothetical protein AVEN_79019-1 [Araneus ventricosus]|uniref:Uncharacterized protein n=1 Tax=Araneus ventricosus TaxID=182803 RepID=A0A4Y2KWF0_ARAVE|nr:hypothetical protein AVEN_79019-1 [Araneus ventricosus]
MQVSQSLFRLVMPGKPSENVAGKPVDKSKLEDFNKLCNILDNKDDCQYLLSNLCLLSKCCYISVPLVTTCTVRSVCGSFFSERYGNIVLISASMNSFGIIASLRPVA